MCEDPGKVVEDWIGAGLRAEFRTSQFLAYQILVEKWHNFGRALLIRKICGNLYSGA